jgi:hypothetical protein
MDTRLDGHLDLQGVDPLTCQEADRMLKASRRLGAALAIACAAAVTLVSASSAQAASYYNIVNTQSGKALQANINGTVSVAPLNKTNPLQQWKRVSPAFFPSPNGGWTETGIQNRLLGCLKSEGATFNNLIAPLKHVNCAGVANDSTKRWSHLAGVLTGSPTVPGFQLVSGLAEYVADFNLCFDTSCPQSYGASLFKASFVSDSPNEFGGAVKWQYKFAVSATP